MVPKKQSKDDAGFIGDWEGEIQAVWESLPPDLRKDLNQTLQQLPGDPRGWRSLLKQAAGQVRFAAGDKKSVAIVGPANV
ncbi:MAG: hypothetical protein PVF85_10995, partial [Anaerolineales bacterium]